MENHAHGDHVSFGKRVLKEVALGGLDSVRKAGGGDVFLGDGSDGRQVKRGARDVRLAASHFDAEQATGAADVAKGLEVREVELLREGFKIDARETGHGAHELFQAREFFVELFEHSLHAVLGFVLRLAGTESFGKIVPELEETLVQHDEDAADISGAGAVEVERAGGGIGVFGIRAVADAVEELHGDQRVEEVGDAARMDADFGTQFSAGQLAGAERGEQFKADGCEEDFRRPEGKGRLKNGTGVDGLHRGDYSIPGPESGQRLHDSLTVTGAATEK